MNREKRLFVRAFDAVFAKNAHPKNNFTEWTLYVQDINTLTNQMWLAFEDMRRIDREQQEQELQEKIKKRAGLYWTKQANP